MTTIHNLGWWYWAITVVLLSVGLFAGQAGIFLGMALWNSRQPLRWLLLRQAYFSVQVSVPPCSEVYRRISLERVHR